MTYGTNNELGFDYLRDNMKMSAAEMVQRGHYFSIVDEVDSILIDEARTPIIISGPLDDRAELYNALDEIMPLLKPEHFELDESSARSPSRNQATSSWSRSWRERQLLKPDTSFYDIENVTVVHHATQALKAHKLFQRDRDYIVKGGQFVIIDEFTGRMMQGRRYSEGLHQALEAKEHVEIPAGEPDARLHHLQNYFACTRSLPA